ncbi:MAG: PilW family protein [Gemmatimonadota bacterium]
MTNEHGAPEIRSDTGTGAGCPSARERGAGTTAAGAQARRGVCRGVSGFTLVEMLIALVITGIMAAGVISLLMGQNRFYGSTDDAVNAEQNLRATSDLLASELRGIHAGSGSASDLVTAQSDELTFRLDTHRGVVCETTADDVYVYLFSEPSAPNVKSSGRGHAVREAFAGSAWTYDGWDPTSGTMSRATGPSHGIAETCEDGSGPEATSSNYSRFVVFEDWSAAEPEVGSILRIYGEVTYEFGDSGFGSGTAILRNDQELAAPFEDDAGFRYVMDGGDVESSTTNFESVERIRIGATAVGEGANRYDVTRDMEFDIPLKN